MFSQEFIEEIKLIYLYKALRKGITLYGTRMFNHSSIDDQEEEEREVLVLFGIEICLPLHHTVFIEHSISDENYPARAIRKQARGHDECLYDALLMCI